MICDRHRLDNNQVISWIDIGLSIYIETLELITNNEALHATIPSQYLPLYSIMTKESGVNAAQTGPVFAELPVESASFGDGEPPPPYTPQASDAITNQPVIHQTIIMQPTLKHFPIFYNCPKCQCQTLTKVKLVKTKKTHMLAGFICGFTCWCLICCLGALPYILPTFQEAEHYCSNCNSLLGKYSRL